MDGIAHTFLPTGKEVVIKDDKVAEALEAEGYIENLDKKPQQKPTLSLKK